MDIYHPSISLQKKYKVSLGKQSMVSLIILAICILCVLVYIYIYRRNTKESFVSNSVVLSNLYETPDEIFLVATNPASFKINLPSDSFNYIGTGYTYADAITACQAVGPGVTLADYSTISTSQSKLSLLTALDLSANWCAAGWVNGNSTYAYFPMSDFTKYKCLLSNQSKRETSSTPTSQKFYLPESKGVGVYNPGPGGKAFAICVGPKPPEPSARINPFNNRNYSMYTPSMMNLLKTGVDIKDPYNLDIFPIEFTDAQAYLALKQNSYSTLNARKWLKDNYSTAVTTGTDPINMLLNPKSETSVQADEWISNSVKQSCVALSDAYSTMNISLSSLKGVFHDLSGIVADTINSKGQNAILQSLVTDICKANPQGVVTKACGRLLSIDYDLFYRNTNIDPNVQTNYITALEIINRDLFQREVEIQQSLGSLQMVLDQFKDESSGEVCATTLTNLISTYGNNMVPNWSTNKLQPIDAKTFFSTNDVGSTITVADETALGSAPLSAFRVGRDIELNGVERLKVNLEEISPYFNAADYTSLISDVLNQLSITLRTPLAIEYSHVESIANNTNKNIDIIVNNVNKL